MVEILTSRKTKSKVNLKKIRPLRASGWRQPQNSFSVFVLSFSTLYYITATLLFVHCMMSEFKNEYFELEGMPIVEKVEFQKENVLIVFLLKLWRLDSENEF